MKIAITGASGFIGSALVPHLVERHTLLLIGRDVSALSKQFPKHDCRDYSALEEQLGGCDAVIHLAVLNSDGHGDAKAFNAANVELTVQVASAAKAAGIERFVFPASFHGNAQTDYARSKLAAGDELHTIGFEQLQTLRLPAVYGQIYRGKLSVLNKVPASLRPLAHEILTSLKPTVHVDHVCGAIEEALQNTSSTEADVFTPMQENRVYRWAKRLIDCTAACVILLLFWWLLVLVWIAVRLTSKGPAVLAQQRVGQHQKTFTLYKFRTMAVGTEQVGTHDVREFQITPLGYWLRRSKIDELPQLFNVLKGQLSLVGPRPCLPIQEQLIKERGQRNVFSVLPGLTGYAQVNGVDMSEPERLAQIDADYLARASIWFDIKVLLQTFGLLAQKHRH